MMKNTNTSFAIANKYIKNIVKNLNITNIKDINKKILKYEDVSYLNELFINENDEVIVNFINEINAPFKDKDYQGIINSVNDLFNENFKEKEILEINEINQKIKDIQTSVNNLISPIVISEITSLVSFASLMKTELDVYIMKHKAGEYVEMSRLREAVKGLMDNFNNAILNLEADMKLSNEEYLVRFKDAVKLHYLTLIDAKQNKITTIPEWGKGLLFCLPWIIGFLIFTLYPLIQTLIFSFSKVELKPSGFETEFIGFTNYINIFTKDTDFIYAISDYIVKIIIYVPIITIFSLMIALLLNTKVKGTGFFRTIFFLPVIITSGPVMKILIEQGVTSIPGLAEIINLEEISKNLPHFVNTALNVLTNEFVMILWFCGIQILVFITGLQKINKGVYEAANIDGASRWERFWKVTIPALNPTIVINVVFTIVMQSLFALNPIIIKIQNDMNDSSGVKGYGYSSAIAFVYFLVMIILLVVFVCIFKKFDHKKRKRGN